MTQTLIKIKNVSKSYYKKKKLIKKALVDINLEIYEAEILSLLGVNGAGKTTLSSIISTIHPPSSGDVIWKDKSIYKDLLSYRQIVGFCPQNQNLDPNLTLEQNLIYQGRYYGLDKKELFKRADYLIDKFELREYAKSIVNVLSGGYKQRFSIARTLIHNPRLVILDEPTVGLDPQVRRQLWDFISKLKEEKITVLLTTHYLDEAEILSDRVCVIDKGKIKIIDTPEKLKTDWKQKNLEDVFINLLEHETEETES